jgi:hypothetical protein
VQVPEGVDLRQVAARNDLAQAWGDLQMARESSDHDFIPEHEARVRALEGVAPVVD